MITHSPMEICGSARLNTLGMELTGEMPQFVERDMETPQAMRNIPST